MAFCLWINKGFIKLRIQELKFESIKGHINLKLFDLGNKSMNTLKIVFKSSFRFQENQILVFQVFKFHIIKCITVKQKNTFN